MGGHLVALAARVCGGAALRYDSGRFRQGPTRDVLTQDHLDARHGCRLEPAAA